MYNTNGYKGGVKKERLISRAFMIAATIIFHISAIYFITRVNFSSAPKSDRTSILYLSPDISLQKHIKPVSLEPHRAPPLPVFISPPNFEIETTRSIQSTTLPADLEPYLNSTSEKYSNVFDPRMRKKLAESNQLVSKPKAEKYKTTYLSNGQMMVEVGDGQCIMSMPKMDSRDRGTTWSTNTVRCGKTDSENFMDNVQRDLDERQGKKQK